MMIKVMEGSSILFYPNFEVKCFAVLSPLNANVVVHGFNGEIHLYSEVMNISRAGLMKDIYFGKFLRKLSNLW